MLLIINALRWHILGTVYTNKPKFTSVIITTWYLFGSLIEPFSHILFPVYLPKTGEQKTILELQLYGTLWKYTNEFTVVNGE